jgi:hypothetical protein
MLGSKEMFVGPTEIDVFEEHHVTIDRDTGPLRGPMEMLER